MRPDCIILTRFAPDQPGFLDFSYRIKTLAGAYRLTVVSAASLVQEELHVEGVEYVVLPNGEGRRGWFKYMLDCTRLVRARKPACVVLLHSLMAPMTWLLGRTPTALYWNEHPSRFTAAPPAHPAFKRLMRKLAMRWLFFEAARRATLVMPIGEAHRDDLLEWGCDPQRVRLIYMGVDKAFAPDRPAPPRPAEKGPLRLVYVGTVSKARGRDIMLEAMRLANRGQLLAHLTMVGADDAEIDYCRRYASRLGISASVRICGRVGGTEIPDILRNADAGLCLWEDQPWWRFNPPTKLFEYLAAGLPVLASDIRTHTQYIASGFNGLIFKYDSFSLGNAIRELARQSHVLEKMRVHAHDSGRQYLWDRLEPQFLQAVQSLHTSPQPNGTVIKSSMDEQDGIQDPVPEQRA